MIGVEIKQPHKVGELLYIFQNNGLIVDQFLFNETSFRIAPPLTITEDEVKQVVSKIIASLDSFQ